MERTTLEVSAERDEATAEHPHIDIVAAAIQLGIHDAGGISFGVKSVLTRKHVEELLADGVDPNTIAERHMAQTAVSLFQAVLDQQRVTKVDTIAADGSEAVLELGVVAFSQQQFAEFLISIEKHFTIAVDTIIDTERQKWIGENEHEIAELRFRIASLEK